MTPQERTSLTRQCDHYGYSYAVDRYGIDTESVSIYLQSPHKAVDVIHADTYSQGMRAIIADRTQALEVTSGPYCPV